MPLAAGSLYGGALADRFDRRRMLLTCQLALVGAAALLCLAAAYPQLAAYDGDAVGAGAVGQEELDLAAERTEAMELN